MAPRGGRPRGPSSFVRCWPLTQHCSPLPQPTPTSSHPPPCSNKVLQAARCDEGFTLHDLMKPDRSRVLRILSALINFQKFKRDKLAWYEELEAKKASRRTVATSKWGRV